MNHNDKLTRLLGTPCEDPDCEAGMAVLAEYVELELAGRNPDELFPSLTMHLLNCPACAEDYEGLVALARQRQRIG
jgi:hypothetical protein